MKDFSAKPRRNPHLAVAVALCILLLTIALTAGFDVVRYALATFADGFFYPWMKLGTPSEKVTDPALLMMNKNTLAAKVEKLTAANRELALQGQSANDLMEENRKLRQKLNLRTKTSPRYITAGIILRDPLHFRDGFTIDKGLRDGVFKGAAVVDVNEHGNLLLVGVITQSDARTSKVTTIVKSSLRISGMAASNQAIGFTNSGETKPNRGRIRFGMLPIRDDYIPGNMVFTTGFERGIPAGIKIGELQTENSHRSLEQEDFSCELLPAVRFESLRFVSVALISGKAAAEEL